MERNFHTITATRNAVMKVGIIKGKHKKWRQFMKLTDDEKFEYLFKLQALVTKSIVWGMKQGWDNITIPYFCSFQRNYYKEIKKESLITETYETEDQRRMVLNIRMKRIRKLKRKHGKQWEDFYVSDVDIQEEIARAEEDDVLNATED